MGCVCSKRKVEREAPLSFSDAAGFSFSEMGKRRSYDSGELRLTPAKAGASKVPEMSSILGKAGIVGLRAVEVLDALGSSMSSLNPSSGFVSGMTVRGNKVSILAFEVANTIAKGANLLRSISDENIQFLKEEILQSDGVRYLVSMDTKELLSIAAADKRMELDVFSGEVIRFGDLCKNTVWHNLGRYFQKLDSDFTPQEHLREEAESEMQQLLNLAQNTSELYHELHALDRFELDYLRKFQEEESLPAARRESLMILQSDLKCQRKLVENLKKKSLWSRNLEEVVEKLVDIVSFLHREILEAFGITGTNSVDYPTVHSQRLGVSGLSLHYANVINRIDSIVSRPLSLPPNTRDTLYQGLPAGVKTALRSLLKSFDSNEEYTVAQIKAEMQKTLRWIVPTAENTIRAHQGFGWVGEWANIGTELNKKQVLQYNVIRIQTLYHADKEKTEKYILELVVWLHRLVIQVKNRGYGIKSIKPVDYYQSQNGSSVQQETKQDPSQGWNNKTDVLQLSEEDREMLDCVVSSKRLVLGRSKSQEFVTSQEKRGQRKWGLSRSCDSSPTRELIAASGLPLEKTQILDVMDGLDTLKRFPNNSFFA